MQRPGEGMAREGDGEVAGLRDAVGGVAHGEMPGARVACAHSQGGVVLVTQWACGWIGRGVRRVGRPGGAGGVRRRRRPSAGKKGREMKAGANS